MQDARIFFFRAHALPPAAHAHTPTHTTSIIKWYPSPPLDPVRTGRAEPQLQGHRSSGAGAAPAQWRHWWRAAGSLQAQLGLEMLRRGMCTCVHHQTSGCFEPYQHACQTAVSTDFLIQYFNIGQRHSKNHISILECKGRVSCVGSLNTCSWKAIFNRGNYRSSGHIQKGLNDVHTKNTILLPQVQHT